MKITENQTAASAPEPMAIVGMACRLPNGANSPDEFWTLLNQGDSPVTPLSHQRLHWPDFVDVDKIHQGIDRAYLIDDVDRHDMGFFGIFPTEAQLMDPQQRLLMELSWETLESAGTKPSDLSGSDTGVFIGVCHHDYRELVAQYLTSPNAYVGTGNIPCMLANRISYHYNFKGPSLTVDTACASSLYALAEGINAIQRGDCQQALIGAVNLILTGTSSVAYYQAGMLSRSTWCNPFDETSDGYLRGEGAGMLLVKPLSAAQENGDNILALVNGCAVNHGGHGRSLTAPNARSQANVIIEALKSAGLTPDAVNYIETHGTGTPVGDPIEFQAIQRGFKLSAKAAGVKLGDNFCALGALKADIGHLESAAGMAALIKVILAMKHQKLPANPRLTKVNPRIKLADSAFSIIEDARQWHPVMDADNQPQPLRAGISSFGFGGTNAHVILQQPPAQARQQNQADRKPAYLFVTSARNAAQLDEQIQRLLNLSDFADLDSADLSHTLINGREHFAHRVACVYRSQQDLLEILMQWRQNKQHRAVYSEVVDSSSPADDQALLAAGQASVDACVDTSVAEGASVSFIGHLSVIAQRFVEGYALDYGRLSAGDSVRLVLNTYPFAKQSYWINGQPVRGERNDHADKNNDANQQPATYLALHSNREQPTEALFFSNHYTGNECFFADHQVAGHGVFPGVAYLALVGQICQDTPLWADSHRWRAISFSDITWLSPMIVNGPTTVWSQLTITTMPMVTGDGHQRVDFQCFGDESKDPTSLLCRGAVIMLTVMDEMVDQGEPLLVPREHLDRGTFSHFDAQTCYQHYADNAIDYGPAHQGIKNLYVDQHNDMILAEITIPSAIRAQFEQLILHPAMLDAALQASMGFRLAKGEQPGEAGMVYLPFALAKLVYLRPVTATSWVKVVPAPTADSGNGECFDIKIYDQHGRLSVRFEGFELRPASKAALRSTAARSGASDVQQVLYLPKWRQYALPETPASDAKVTLVIGASQPQLAMITAARETAISCDLSFDADITTIKQTLFQAGEFAAVVVVFAANPTQYPWQDGLIGAQYDSVKFLLLLTQALSAGRHHVAALDLTLVTRNSLALYASDVIDPTHTGVHGMAGSMAKEFGHWSIRMVDLPAFEPSVVEALFNLPHDPQGNVWLSRNQQWYQQQLVPCDMPQGNGASYTEGGVYLIIGGAGGLGELYSEHLIQQAQAQIVWLGSSECSVAIEQKLTRLAALGPTPIYLKADAADAQQLRQARNTIIERFGKINGIVHSAMVLDDTMLVNMTESNLQRVLRVKVDSCVHLSQVFKDAPLDFVLFFSSANAFLKSPGQANYVAGCTFMDAAAHVLRQQWATQIKVVNWGYWGTLGAVADEKYSRKMGNLGFASIEPDQAMAFLDRLMTSAVDQACYLATNGRPLQLGVPVSDSEFIQALVDPLPDCFAGSVKPSPWDIDSATYDQEAKNLTHSLLPLIWYQLKQAGLVLRQSREQDHNVYLAIYLVQEGRFDDWLDETLSMLVELGWLKRTARQLMIEPALDEALDNPGNWAHQLDNLANCPGQGQWVALLQVTIRHLAAILTAERSAVDVLFAGEGADPSLVEGVYKYDKALQLFNQSLADTVKDYVAQRVALDPQAQIKLFEIGAGTGATSEVVFDRLNDYQANVADYCFTDISPMFTLRAHNNYAATVPYLSHDTFDIEAVASHESRHYGQYDVVIATNVLHATKDIQATLANAATLLKKNGLLLINEISDSSVKLHLTFGLLDGWWLSQDKSSRIRGCPGLTPESWHKNLTQAGFLAVAFPCQAYHGLGYQFIAAQSSGLLELTGDKAQQRLTRSVSSMVSKPPSTTQSKPTAVAQSAAPAEQSDLMSQLSAVIHADKAAAAAMLQAYLLNNVAQVLFMDKADLDKDSQPFSEVVLGNLGLDSLLSSNLRYQVLKDTDVDLPVQIFIGDKVRDIVEALYQQLLLNHVSADHSSEEQDDLEQFVF